MDGDKADALAGPLAGWLAAAVCVGLYLQTHYLLWAALARAGAGLNVLNLIPIWVLDGAQAANALGRTARLALKWQATDSLSFTPSVFYQKREVDDTAAWWAPRPGEPDPTGGQFSDTLRNGNAIAQPGSDAGRAHQK